MKTYLVDLAVNVAASIAGGVSAVVSATGADITEGKTWLGGLLAGAVAGLVTLASRLRGDANSGTFTK